MNPPGILCNMQMLICKAWDVTSDSVLITNSQVMLMLPVWSMGHALSSKISLLPVMQMKTLNWTGYKLVTANLGACRTGTISSTHLWISCQGHCVLHRLWEVRAHRSVTECIRTWFLPFLNSEAVYLSKKVLNIISRSKIWRTLMEENKQTVLLQHSS